MQNAHMTLPRVPADLTLAPVAVAIDQNLQYLRTLPIGEVCGGIELETDQRATQPSREARAAVLLSVALRNVNLHSWSAELTADSSRVHLDGGSVTLDIGLSPAIVEYVEGRLGRS